MSSILARCWAIDIPNIACALLFEREPDRLLPGCKIRFLRYEGELEGTGRGFNVVKDLWVENVTIPHMIERAERILDGQVRTFSVLGSDGKFYTTPEYPKLAWYEAIVNACVHRSYSNGLRNMMIFIKMFDDRLVIESPGPLPPLVTPENIYGTTHPRNPKLMQAMYFLRFVKMAAEGTRRIRDTMLEMKLPPPEFEQKDVDGAKVRVTLRNNIRHRREWVDTEAADIVGAALAATLSEHEKRVLNFVAEHGQINVSQTGRLTGTSWGTAKNTLSRLVQRGFLEHIHRGDIERDSTAHYRLPLKPS